MASRKYRRDSRGRFAGSAGGGGGTFVTTGKAGGFANQAFRARVAAGSPKSGRGSATRLAKGRKRVGNFVKKHPIATGKMLGVGVTLGLGIAGAARADRNPQVRNGLSLVNKNAALYGKNARSKKGIIALSRGRL